MNNNTTTSSNNNNGKLDKRLSYMFTRVGKKLSLHGSPKSRTNSQMQDDIIRAHFMGDTDVTDLFEGTQEALPVPEKRIARVFTEEEATKFITEELCRIAVYNRWKSFLKSPELKEARLREQTIKEIISTERSYLAGLNVCIQVFYDPLAKLIDEDQLNDIFSNIKQIKLANERFLIDLEESTMTVGQLFKRMSPFFKIYTEYVKNYDIAVASIERLQNENKKFAQFLEKQYALPQINNQRMTSYLILPVQRIPRYRLLLQDLLRRTPEEHVDFLNLTLAEKEVSKVASFVNESKRKEENDQSLIGLQDILTGRFNNLVLAHRTFVAKGILRIYHDDALSTTYDSYIYNDVLLMIPIGFANGKGTLENVLAIYFALSEIVEVPEEDECHEYHVGVATTYMGFPRTYVITAYPDEFKDFRESLVNAMSLVQKAVAKRLEQQQIENGPNGLKDKRLAIHSSLSAISEKGKSLNRLLEDSVIKKETLLDEAVMLEELFKDMWMKLQAKRAELEQFRVLHSKLTEKSELTASRIQQNLNSLAEVDLLIMRMLNSDDDAFREIFGELPKRNTTNSSSTTTTATTTPVRPRQRHTTIRAPRPDIQALMKEEQENETVNPLYRCTPPDSWRFTESQSMPAKYEADRLYLKDFELLSLPKEFIEKGEEVAATTTSLPDEGIPEMTTDVQQLQNQILQLRKEADYWKAKCQTSSVTDGLK